MDPITFTISLGAAGVGGGGYWISETSASDDIYLTGVKTDSSGDVYAAGYINTAARKGYVLKLNGGAGSSNWQRSIVGSSGTNAQKKFEFKTLSLDSSDNLFAAGDAPGSNNPSGLALFPNSGNSATYAKTFSTFSFSDDRFEASASDSSGNSYAGGAHFADSSTYNTGHLVKYNSSGTQQAQKSIISSSSYYDIIMGLDIDSSGNIYVSMESSGITGHLTKYKPVVMKLTSSFGVTWQKFLSVSTQFAGAYGIAVDSSGNVYQCSTNYISFSQKGTLIKYNSSGTFQWYVYFDTSFTADQNSQMSVAIDSADDIYTAGYRSTKGVISKFDSSGTEDWSLEITHSSDSVSFYDVAIDDEDNVIATGNVGTEGLVIKLPSDGSITGTYGSYTIASSTISDSKVTSATTGNATLSISDETISDSSPSVTDSTESYTFSTETL